MITVRQQNVHSAIRADLSPVKSALSAPIVLEMMTGIRCSNKHGEKANIALLLRCNGIFTCESKTCQQTGTPACDRPDLCIPGPTPGCYQCNVDGDCSDTPLRPYCRVADHTCKECLANDQCVTTERPFCDTSDTFTCEECLISSNCPGYDDW